MALELNKRDKCEIVYIVEPCQVWCAFAILALYYILSQSEFDIAQRYYKNF